MQTDFRLTGSPLPRGSRTLWIAAKGFRLLYVPFPGPRFILTQGSRLADGPPGLFSPKPGQTRVLARAGSKLIFIEVKPRKPAFSRHSNF